MLVCMRRLPCSTHARTVFTRRVLRTGFREIAYARDHPDRSCLYPVFAGVLYRRRALLPISAHAARRPALVDRPRRARHRRAREHRRDALGFPRGERRRRRAVETGARHPARVRILLRRGRRGRGESRGRRVRRGRRRERDELRAGRRLPSRRSARRLRKKFRRRGTGRRGSGRTCTCRDWSNRASRP